MVVLASLVFALPAWGVVEFRDLKSGKYGRAASEAIAKELSATRAYDVLPSREIRWAMDKLALKPPLKEPAELSRVAVETMGKTDAERTVVSGEVLDFVFRNVKGGRQAMVALRVTAYNVDCGLPINGALEKGESQVRAKARDEELLAEALKSAAETVVKRLQSQIVPIATMVNTTTRAALINQGAKGGFRSGDVVIVTRQGRLAALGRIGIIEPDQAEIVFDRITVAPGPGDRVQGVFALPPILPLPVFRDLPVRSRR